MEKWVVTAKSADFQGLGAHFSLDPVIVRIIRNREVIGREAMEEYLHGGLSMLHDPRQMKDMEKAAEILGIRKYELIDLYDRLGLPYLDQDIQEVEDEVQYWKKLKGVEV